MVEQKYRKRTVSEMYSNAFYQFHKFLMPIKISEGAKIMYAIMDERYRQSLSNGWVDSEGNCYFQLSNEELRKIMYCSNQTVVNRREELIAEGLLLEEKVPGRATRKYLTVPIDYIQENEEIYAEYDSRLKSRRQPSKSWTPAVYNVDTSNKDLIRNINNNTSNDVAVAPSLYNSDLETLGQAFTELTGKMVNSIQMGDLEYDLKLYGMELILYAFEIAKENKKRYYKYVCGILKNWRESGIQTVEQAKQHTASFGKKAVKEVASRAPGVAETKVMLDSIEAPQISEERRKELIEQMKQMKERIGKQGEW